MIFRQLLDPPTSTLTYLIADPKSRRAALIDCVFEQHLRDLALIRELDLELEYTIETHVHADHVTGAWLMSDALGSKITAGSDCGAEGLDVSLAHGDMIDLGDVSLEVRATPGHTDGCISLVAHEQAMIFTGDALLIRGAGRTDFQQGDPRTLFRSVREQIFSLPDHVSIYPGHDYSGRTLTTVAEEKVHNPRLGEQVREEDFVGYMNHLGLPHPKMMAAAVPANLRSGRPEGHAPAAPTWGPIIRTFAGVWQVEPEWVHQHAEELTLVDVRERAEVEASPMGSVSGARVLPLSELGRRIEEIPRDRPVVFVCPAGARSANAATMLDKAGYDEVANMRGGLLEWHALGLPLVRASN